MRALATITACLAAACVTPPGKSAAQLAADVEVQQLADTILPAIADEVVTPDEGVAIKLELGKAGAAIKAAAPPPASVPSPWLQGLADVAASIVAMYFGIRVMPNRHILGTEHDPDVARVAGVSHGPPAG